MSKEGEMDVIKSQPFTQLRRQDRAVQDETWIEDFLVKAPYGILAMAIDNQPYAKPNLFTFDPLRRAIYLHTADEGRTIENIRINPMVCFTVAEIGRLLPAERARGFSVEYASVVVFGLARVLEDSDERLHGLNLLMRKYAPHLQPDTDYRAVKASELEGTAVYRIDVTGWSGKRKQAETNFPGAYNFKK